MRMTALTPRLRASGEEGFTMLFALLALFVGSLLVAAAFSAANGDVKLSKKATLQAKAYYAAVAGVERYQYQISSNPNYWIECPEIKEAKAVPGTTDETYVYKTLGSAAAPTGCTANKQATILETTGNAKGTFRILSTGTAGAGATAVTRRIVATFAHPGFTKYVYESNYEVEDPVNFGLESKVCEFYYAVRVKEGLTGKCKPIQFAPEDKVNGPMHTNDAAEVCALGSSKPTFGRNSEDPIEMNGGHYEASGCENEINEVGKYTESAGSLLPPETDTELLEAAEYKFSGRTVLKLKTGSPNTIEITNSVGAKETKSFPKNGVIYVENASSGCGLTYTPFNSNTTGDTGCGNVYVSGEYTESLTVASAGDVIVNGNLKTTSESEGKPTGGATLGLIAENYVRLYHPVQSTYEVAHKTAGTMPPVGTKKETCFPVQYKGQLTNGSTTISSMSSTEGLSANLLVTGSNIPSNTTIKEVKASEKKIVLNNKATSTKETTLTFTSSAAEGKEFEYKAAIKNCVEEAPSGYTLKESELLFVKSCNTFNKKTEAYVSNGECAFTNSSSGCDAENENSTEDPNKWGSLSGPTIDAAILSTNHSWIVDNYQCGNKLGELNVWGSIAQFWRGPVGTSGGEGTGYIKNYNYDERLASQQPPSFLSPSSTSWKLSRETAPPTTFCSSGKC